MTVRILASPIDRAGTIFTVRCPYCRMETVEDADGVRERAARVVTLEHERSGSYFTFVRSAA